jgi:hypothetical protein
MKQTLFILVNLLSASWISAQTTNPAPYCKPNFKNPASIDDRISSIKLNAGTAFTSTLYNGSNYVFYNNLAPMVIPAGSTNTMTITGIKTNATAVVLAIYIDLDHSNDFTDPAEEFIQANPINQTNWTGFVNFTIPATADTGLTRLRVVAYEHSSVVGFAPCPNGAQTGVSPDYGEGEDYNVRIVTANSISDHSLQTFKLFPNPASGVVHLDMNLWMRGKVTTAHIIDVFGKQVLTCQLTDRNDINIAGLTDGIYQIIILSDDTAIGTSRLVIQK